MTPELHVQKFLRAQDTSVTPSAARPLRLIDLEREYGIKATRHKRYPSLVLLKYNQIESPMAEPLVQECRGLILDETNNWAVVAMPFTKFWNAGEPLAATIDWHTAVAQEKLDGSLMTLYFYDGTWYVATSGTPDAECNVGDWDITFKDLFWETFAASGGRVEKLRTNYCYMFELCAPQNRVVVQHDKARLYLHGIRNLSFLKEERPALALADLGLMRDEGFEMKHIIRTPRTWPLGSLEEVVAAAAELQPLEQEGYVVCDANFNRIKVKSPKYVLLHHAKDGLVSRRHVAEVVRKGETSEALSYFPELRSTFDNIKARYDQTVHDIDLVWKTINHVEDQKTFAQMATRHPFSGALFAMKAGKATSPAEYIQKLTEPSYHRLLGL